MTTPTIGSRERSAFHAVRPTRQPLASTASLSEGRSPFDPQTPFGQVFHGISSQGLDIEAMKASIRVMKRGDPEMQAHIEEMQRCIMEIEGAPEEPMVNSSRSNGILSRIVRSVRSLFSARHSVPNSPRS